jgi:hypothetical protein
LVCSPAPAATANQPTKAAPRDRTSAAPHRLPPRLRPVANERHPRRSPRTGLANQAGADPYDQIALHRAEGGGMARVSDRWLDGGHRVPGYVTDAPPSRCRHWVTDAALAAGHVEAHRRSRCAVVGCSRRTGVMTDEGGQPRCGDHQTTARPCQATSGGSGNLVRRSGEDTGFVGTFILVCTISGLTIGRVASAARGSS